MANKCWLLIESLWRWYNHHSSLDCCSCLMIVQSSNHTIEQVLAHTHVQEADTMLDNAKEHNVAFLVVGDPFG